MYFNPQTTAELIDAILVANSFSSQAHTIVLKSNQIYLISTAYAGGSNGLPPIGSTITIIGNQATIMRDASTSNLFRIFQVNSTHSLTLVGVNLRNGKLYTSANNDRNFNGGAICNFGSLTMRGCQVIDNSVRFTYLGGSGGAIFTENDAYTTISDCIFIGNRAYNGGALSAARGTVTVTNSVFQANTTGPQVFGSYDGSGGALHIGRYYALADAGGTLTVKGCTIFENNAADGGAIYIEGANAIISGNFIFNNVADDLGGCLFIRNTLGVSVYPVSITNNSIHDNQSNGLLNPASNAHDIENQESATYFSVDATQNWWGASSGPTRLVGTTLEGLGDSISSKVLFDPWLKSEDCVHKATCECPINYAANDCFVSGNPISLRMGEKRVDETDITLQTTVGALNFTRSYRQDKQIGSDPFTFMGLGWTHNHNLYLDDPGSNEPILMTMPQGGQTVFEYDTTLSQYVVKAGSNSTITIAPLSTDQRYTITAADKTKFIFNSNKVLRYRIWPNGETWTYDYYQVPTDPDDVDGKLKSVSDAYGRSLQFTYYHDDYPTSYFQRKLRRVGDQDATGLDGDTPDGTFVEFSYSIGGVLGDQVLLTTVRDVLAQDWLYTYYGQQSGETDPALYNLLTRRISPILYTRRLTLEKLNYAFGGIDIAVNGTMELDSDWLKVGTPPTNICSQEQVYDGDYSRKVVADALQQGIQGTVWSLVAGRTYSISAYVYIDPSNSGTVQMQVTGASAFNQSTSVTGGWVNLVAPDYTPTDTTDCRLQFLVTAKTGSQVIYFVDDVSIIETNLQITQQRGIDGFNPPLLETQYQFAPALGRTLETVAGITRTHYFDAGIYAGTEDALGHRAVQTPNPNFRVGKTTDANGNTTFLNWSSDGKQLQEVVDPQGNQTSFSYENDVLDYSLDAQGRKTQYLYTNPSFPRQPTDIKVIDTNGTMVLHWQKIAYDSLGRVASETIVDPADGTTVLQQTTRDYYDTNPGNGLLWRITQEDMDGGNSVVTTYFYDNSGRVVKKTQSSNFGSCEISYTVYDRAGNVVATICNYDPGSNPDPTDAASAAALYDPTKPDKNQVTTYEYDALGRRVQTVTNAGAPFAQTSLTLYDALNRVTRTITNFVPYAEVPDPISAKHDDFYHGADNTQNLVRDTDYNARGMVRKQIDVAGNTTLFGYDEAGRLVKTVQNASRPDYNNDYVIEPNDPTLATYPASTAPDKDIITSQSYDAAGNVVLAVDAQGITTFTLYDGLNRPIRTIRALRSSARLDLNPGDDRYDTGNDPRSSEYRPSPDPDQDFISTTEYDELGRVIRTRRLLDVRPTELWDTTLYGYDALGRQCCVIRSASQPEYIIASDPSLAKYPVNSSNDVDIITQTFYDVDGRVLYTQDALGNQIWAAYDGLNRQVKTIVNPTRTATDNGVNDPRSPFYNPTTNIPDQDLISQVTFDDGRVLFNQDILGRRTWMGYDTLGRTVKTVTNAVGTATDGGPSDPRSPSYIRSSASDRDIVSQTEYDNQGRVTATVDTRGNRTQYYYDTLGRRIRTIVNFVDGVFNPNIPDEDRNETVIYDFLGRVVSSRDAAGLVTQYTYDALGRRVKTVVNYVDGRFNSAIPDEDLITTTTYNQAGQVVSTTDVRGTQTTFTYDRAGRQLTVTRAANTGLASTSYTCYDKAGRVLRAIQNWMDDGISPDAKTENTWNFQPEAGPENDRNLITQFAYDRAGRRSLLVDPTGSVTITAYFKDGQVDSITDPERTVTVYRYDRLRRRVRVVQGYVANGDDPARWYWSSGWKRTGGIAIVNGTDNDENVVVDVSYDKAGRMLSLRNPQGYVTTYEYDLLDRRTKLTNALTPLPQSWITRYTNMGNTTRTSVTYPGVNTSITGLSTNVSTPYDVHRDFNRLGQLTTITYPVPSTTPNVFFTYDVAGNRSAMVENNGTSTIRRTIYGYDDLHRVTSVGYDNNGDGTIDETLSYEYEVGGQRTKLTMPGSLNIVYTYDAKGQLLSMTDWDSQTTQFAYDLAGRQALTLYPNGMCSRYQYDPAGHLRVIRTMVANKVLSYFGYEVDGRGNRTQAREAILKPTTSPTDTVISATNSGLLLTGTWADASTFKETTQFSANLAVMFIGDQATLTMGTGPDHGIYDLYIDGSLWQSIDGYAGTANQRDIVITSGLDNRNLQTEGPHLLEIRNRPDKNKRSSGYKLRFKQLLISAHSFDVRTISYRYDQLSRLLEARYNPNVNVLAGDFSLEAQFKHTYDLAGNQTSYFFRLASGFNNTYPRYYNEINQLIRDEDSYYGYDANGNRVSVGGLPGSLVPYISWDHANRMVSGPSGTNIFVYDGLGNRLQQTVSGATSIYLQDIQPGLAVALRETKGATTTLYLHGPHGIQALKDSAGWHWIIQDGLGSVRGVVDSSGVIQESRVYTSYGEQLTFNVAPAPYVPTSYNFTGEPYDTSVGLYLRARYYFPARQVFYNLDPFEGTSDRPMSLNGYSWVEGNVPNATDPSGMFDWDNFIVEPGDYPVCIAREGGVLIPHGNQPYAYYAKWLEEFLKANNLASTNEFPLPGTKIIIPDTVTLEDGYTLINIRKTGKQNSHTSCSVASTTAPTAPLPPPNPQTPNPTQSCTGSAPVPGGTIIGGYLEGVSYSAGVASKSGSKGEEIVYNFATFERMNFEYEALGYSIVPSAGGSSRVYYIGHVEGFLRNEPGHSFDKFISQYSELFNVYQVGAGAGISLGPLGSLGASGGVIHYETPGRCGDWVYGNAFYMGANVTVAGIQVPKGLEASLGIANYKPLNENRISYLNAKGCVDRERLGNDIRYGTGSQIPETLGQPLWSVVLGTRINASIFADIAAMNYNNSKSGCS